MQGNGENVAMRGLTPETRTDPRDLQRHVHLRRNRVLWVIRKQLSEL